MANPEHVKVVKQGAEAIARWRKQHPEERLDLRDADLSGVDLSKAVLIMADFWGANLFEADLSMANISLADLTAANLNKAKLTGAKLIAANIIATNLSEADLGGADLSLANLNVADLSGADFTKSKCHYTIFSDCNLQETRGLQTLKHEGSSTIGVDTLITSLRAAGNKFTPELETFFRGAGVPKELLDALPGIIAEVIYCSCFISYGEPDKKFAQKLCHDLETKGVSCWLYSMDATPGERTWREIGQKRREAEKMIVLCSAQALVRDGVLKEIEEQIDEDQDKMVPISLDDLWRAPGFRVMRGNTDLKPSLYPVRNYVDFSDASSYEKSLERLLKGLKRKQS